MMRANPHVKICQARNANYTAAQAVTILEDLSARALFVDYFSHNVRNYLLQSKKLAVALITNNANTSTATSFFGAYMSLQGTPPLIQTSQTSARTTAEQPSGCSTST
jgi:hypothetical protein